MKFLILLLLFISSLAYSSTCIMPSFQEEVTTTGNTLKEIEQAELTNGQCKIFQKEFKRRSKNKSHHLEDLEFNRAKVLCGKWMFINLGMKTKIGIPQALLKSISKMPEIGNKFEGLGLLSDETWKDEKFPFGVVEAKHLNPFSFKRTTTNKIAQISCAGCHTGKLTDGRYSLGMTNEEFDYGKFNQFTLFSIWMVDRRKEDTTRWLPELISKYRKLESENNDFFLKLLKTAEALPINDFLLRVIIGEEPPPLETQRSFLNSSPGVFNGFAPSLNFNDKQIYLTAPQIWEFGTEAESHYGTLAAKNTPEDFVSEAFIYTTRSTRYSKAQYLTPIAEYLKCIKAPVNLKIKDSVLYDQGEKVFKTNCTSCHDLNHGGGTFPVSPKDIGTPSTYIELFKEYLPTEIQSKDTFKVIKKLNLDNSATDIKVRRLNGIWTRQNLTSNGQIKGIDHLFCLNGKKREILDTNNPKTQSIHLDLCENYTDKEKKALIEYLNYL